MYITKFLFMNLRITESTFNIEQLSAELQTVSPILITEKHTNLIIGGLSLNNRRTYNTHKAILGAKEPPCYFVNTLKLKGKGQNILDGGRYHC